MTESSSHAECGDAAGESGDDALKCLSFFRDHPQDGELEIQQLDEEVCALRVTIQDLLSQSAELDHKRSDLSHESHLLHSMINDKRGRVTVQKLIEFQEQLKDLERRESGLESKLLICEEEFSNLSGSKSGSVDLDIHLSDSINKFHSLKMKLSAKMRASFSLRCQLNDAPVQTELIQYEKRFSELYAQIQEKHRLTRRYYATYNALLEIKELMLKEASLLNSINLQFKDAMTTPSGQSKLLDTMEVILKGTKQKLEKTKQDLLVEQKVLNSFEEKHAIEVAAERHFPILLKTFQDACAEYDRLREVTLST
ncbi:hypothetical protein KSP39_PZI011963 [Platanthera zijinensis]|uniref:CCDC93 coiled-coil domain-containing protein n=1 Tax=Platanthera zijinensis TaxID=2320716 RepID=A0AAP0BF00_9ASPA